MAWSRVQSNKNSTASLVTSLAVAYTSNLTSGTKLICIGSISTSSPGTPTVAVGGNALTQIQIINGTNQQTILFAADTPAGLVGTAPTVTITWNATGDCGMVIQEVSGLATGNTLAAMIDGTAGTKTGNGGTSTGSPTYSSSASSEYLVSVYGDDGGPETWTAPYGSTSANLDPNSINTNSNTDIAIGYTNSTGGAEVGSWSLTGTAADWSVILCAFKVAATAAAGGGVSQAQPGQTWLRRFHHRQGLPLTAAQPGVLNATAEVAVVGVAAPFQTGGETDLQLIADSAIALPVVAVQPVPAVTVTAGVAVVGAVAAQPSVTTSGSTSANAAVAAVSVVAVAPTTAVTVTAAVATVSVVAPQPTTAATATSGIAVIGAVAPQPTAAATAAAAVAVVGVVAPQPTTAATATAGVGIVGVVANQPSVATSGSTNANAAAATSSAVAPQPTAAITVRAAVAVVGIVGNAATVSTAAFTNANAGVAAVGVAARAPSVTAQVFATVAVVAAAGVRVPPPFTVGALAASDRPLGVLSASTAGGGSGAVLTASDTRLGGPGG